MRSSYSSEARRLAARAMGVLRERSPERKAQDRDPAAPPPVLDAVPLDRRRSVPFGEMDDEDLGRALEQARRRVERTGRSADLQRYEDQVIAIEAETVRRARAAVAEKTASPPPPPPSAPPPRFEGDDDGVPGPRTSPGPSPQQHPADTPESPAL